MDFSSDHFSMVHIFQKDKVLGKIENVNRALNDRPSDSQSNYYYNKILCSNINFLNHRLDISILLSHKKFSSSEPHSNTDVVQKYEITDVDYEKVCVMLFYRWG